MEIQQIIDVIIANQHMSYDDVKKQATEAGLSSVQLDQAWREAKLDASVDNDKRVADIIDEMRLAKKETKTIYEWKEYFKQKGYLDDEVDLAYVLADAKIEFSPFHPWILWIIVTLIIGIIGYMIYDNFNNLGEYFSQFGIQLVVVLASLIVAYFSFIVSQFRKFTAKIIRLDFNALPAIELRKWRLMGSKLLSYPSAKITSLFEMEYDGRQTFCGEYQYTVGSGKNRHTYYYSFIAQKTHKELPLVHCFAPWMDRSFFDKEVQLEGKEFNDHYNIYAENPRDAFYVFNPRVMSAMLEKEIVKELKSFETVGNYILMSFTNLPLRTPLRFKAPLIRFVDYESLKSKMLHRLDLASDINDTLSRQIVDDGEKRSVAKNK